MLKLKNLNTRFIYKAVFNYPKMSRTYHQCIVVGAGIEGSSTALYLANQGIKTLLVDQFSLPHSRGSSGGESRLIRSAYNEDFFNLMMLEAFRMWKDIEDQSKENILVRGGVLCFAKPPHDRILTVEANMTKFNGPDSLDVLSPEEMARRYPLIKLSKDHHCFLDKTGGVVKAKTAMQAIQKLFQQKGGQIHAPFKPDKLEFKQKKIVLSSGTTSFETDKVVFCCGPWTNKVLNGLGVGLNLPLQPERLNIFYFREKENVHTLENNFLPFLQFDAGDHVYGFPSLEYPGFVKILSNVGVPCDPDERDKAPFSSKDRELVKSFIEEHFKTIETEPAIVEACMYTMTPDEIFILDKHPQHENIVIGAGFSGTGFKIAPIVGKVLGNLALGEPIEYDMKPFKISRFN